MKHYIGLVGYGKVGKDTALEALNEAISVSGHKFNRIAFADPLKEDLQRCIKRATKALIAQGVPEQEHKERLRPIYEFYGTSFMRSIDDKIWLKDGLDRAQRCRNRLVCFTDVRNTNEADAILDRNGVLFNIVKDGESAKGKIEAESIPELLKLRGAYIKTIPNNGTKQELGEAIFYSRAFQNLWKRYMREIGD